MQLLNISVNNRPSRSVTSRPYASYLTESVNFDMAFIAEQSNYVSGTDQYQMGIGIMDGLVRELLIKLPMGIFNASHEVGIVDCYLTRDVTYHKYSIGTHGAQYGLGITDLQITREIRYLKHIIDLEQADYSVGIESLQLI